MKKLRNATLSKDATAVAVVAAFRMMGLLDWGTALGSIGATLVGDVAVCAFWWHFGDL